MRLGEVHFQFPAEKVRCYFNSYTTYQQQKKNRSRRRHHSSQHHKNRLLKNEEEKNNKEEEPMKDMAPTSKSTSPRMRV
jgi:hypothetical protein